MHRSRNNVLAGLLVIIAIIGTVFAIVVLGGALDAFGRRSYVVVFDLATGVEGLKEGADVRVGGIDVGAVEGVRLADGRIEVDIGVDGDVELRDGAVAELKLALLGGQGVINFPSLGEGPAIAPGGELPGAIAPPGFLAQAGVGEEQVERIRSIIANADAFMEGARDVGPEARAFLSDVRERWEAWKPRFDEIIDNVDASMEQGPELVENVRLRVDQASELMATAQGYLDENREDVRRMAKSFANVGEEGETFMAQLNGELTDRARALLDQGQATLARAEDAIVDVDNTLAESRPEIRRSLANFRLASDQLRDTLLEVRQAPWRLLYRPDTRELDFELLYDAARSYAGAVSDLQAASASLEAYGANASDPTVARRADVDGLIAEINDAFTRYRDAEQTFLDVLLRQAGEDE